MSDWHPQWRPFRAIKVAIARELAAEWIQKSGHLNEDGSISKEQLETLKFCEFSSWLHTRYLESRFKTNLLGGHIKIGPITFYGSNAMHFAVNIRMRNGYICLRPPTISMRGVYRAPYVYFSHNATPGEASWGWCAPCGYDSWIHQQNLNKKAGNNNG